ncbi:RNA polymerase sigma factor, sigma-70 family [Synechococcus sp. PCC 7335]|uniref:sigma-70 family RNA polymerase sigma factor n=1 Tax=Synechococcus sp. (strain ATCC 29403 / PCC 7335) TaxID=91464 RepID=UPI00017EB460|nr:sigma-70 family RNA polymerase sigma factor [Synechococcus sp. PCC 7335]EDX86613.1 RNA polymerase sigma factor, sigma-70 family [Synechococcus sp. PCC 7335]
MTPQLAQRSTQSEPNTPVHMSLLKTSLTQLSNSELILRCQKLDSRDRTAFEELVARYHRYIDKLLFDLASDWLDRTDLAQEVWIRVYKSIHKLNDPTKFKSWLSRITTNLFYDELRKRKRFQRSVSLDAPRYLNNRHYEWELPSDQPTPTDDVLTREFRDYLEQAMSELPQTFRETIALRELQGLSYEEIASMTGVSLGTVKSRIARARRKLQEKLSIYRYPPI